MQKNLITIVALISALLIPGWLFGSGSSIDSESLGVIGGGGEATALRVTIASNSTGTLTIDNPTLTITGGGGEVGAQRVTIASDSSGILSVDDNGGSLTVDFTSSFSQETTGITTVSTGSAVDMSATPMHYFTMIVDRTAGATDVVDIDLQCSINGTAFVSIANIASLVGEPVLINPVETVPCNEMRYDVVDVGAGNTLAIDLLATR